MTRHQRNATASSVYTYHERKKDQKASGYGSLKERLGKDAVTNFDCCSLTLQPCRNPVVTPDGYLFDKEAILEYLLHQKREVARQLKEYDRQKRKEERELEELAKAAKESEAKKFIAQESTPARVSVNNEINSTPGSSNSVSNMSDDKKNKLPSFWLPSLTGSLKTFDLEKPDFKICCPMSGNPLKFKDLLSVKFHLAKDADEKSSFDKDRYVCAVTKDVLTNATPLAVLKKSMSSNLENFISGII
uniref:Nitric oxide synthase-interacting protein zinc-finger domain-containing protein n=1 Tax=Romanomermis culicivorax TaxID=13658 RepID=A0A915KCQ5_ROMCU